MQTRHDKILHPSGGEEFEYDEVSRLKSVWQLDTQGNRLTQTRSFAYERNGNIKIKSDVDPTTPYTYDPAHPHAVKTAGLWTFGYDAVGNQTSRTEAGGSSQSVVYTPFNLPKSVTTTPTIGDPVTTDFKYNAEGERARKSTLGVTTDYYAGIYERTEDIPAGTTTHKYWIYAGTRKIAQVEHVDDGAVVDRGTLYLHQDAIGSISAISGDIGVHVNQGFEPFGERDAASHPDAKKVTAGFTGHEHDDELGLINMRGRIQDPHIGNFLSADPYVSRPGFSQSFNRYAYVTNNPLNYVDPSGFKECVETASDKNGALLCKDKNGVWSVYNEATDTWRLDEVETTAECDAACRMELYKERAAEADKTIIPDRGEQGGEGGGDGAEIGGAEPGAEEKDCSGGDGGGGVSTIDAVQAGLDATSIGLDATGIGATVSWVPDLVNAGISVGRGDWLGASLSAAAMVPGIGNAANLGRLGRAGAGAAETLTRFGTEFESAAKLGAQAAEAEAKIGVHGVSVTAREVSGPAGRAERSAVETVFPVHNTGRPSLQHRTVELPKPVTARVAATFNRLFGRACK